MTKDQNAPANRWAELRRGGPEHKTPAVAKKKKKKKKKRVDGRRIDGRCPSSRPTDTPATEKAGRILHVHVPVIALLADGSRAAVAAERRLQGATMMPGGVSMRRKKAAATPLILSHCLEVQNDTLPVEEVAASAAEPTSDTAISLSLDRRCRRRPRASEPTSPPRTYHKGYSRTASHGAVSAGTHTFVAPEGWVASIVDETRGEQKVANEAADSKEAAAGEAAEISEAKMKGKTGTEETGKMTKKKKKKKKKKGEKMTKTATAMKEKKKKKRTGIAVASVAAARRQQARPSEIVHVQRANAGRDRRAAVATDGNQVRVRVRVLGRKRGQKKVRVRRARRRDESPQSTPPPLLSGRPAWDTSGVPKSSVPGEDEGEHLGKDDGGGGEEGIIRLRMKKLRCGGCDYYGKVLPDGDGDYVCPQCNECEGDDGAAVVTAGAVFGCFERDMVADPCCYVGDLRQKGSPNCIGLAHGQFTVSHSEYAAPSSAVFGTSRRFQ